jgi:hypothetical protein
MEKIKSSGSLHRYIVLCKPYMSEAQCGKEGLPPSQYATVFAESAMEFLATVVARRMVRLL